MKQGGKIVAYCSNGTISNVTDDMLIKILTSFDKPHIFKGTDGVWNTSIADMSDVIGDTLAYIDDSNKLVVLDNKVFSKILKRRFISATEYADLHHKSRASIKNMCGKGRIEGAYQTSSGWLIPADAPYPQRKKRTVKAKT